MTEKYLSASASAQILADAASQYGFYRKQDKAEDSWVGIPLWVHRRCRYPMFTISNMISYDGFMVQGMEKYGKQTGLMLVERRTINMSRNRENSFCISSRR